MRLANFVTLDDPKQLRWGAIVGENLVDLASARSWTQRAHMRTAEFMPTSLMDLIHSGEEGLFSINNLLDSLKNQDFVHLKGSNGHRVGYELKEVFLNPPLLRPPTVRDFYAFEAHVKAANAIRGREIPPEWYEFPAFYYSNPNAVFGHLSTIPYPSYTQELDYELEVACIIGKTGRNISPETSEVYIFGYTILNDWSARDIQRKEIKIGLGPAKAKDFALSLGPWIVTRDELAGSATGRPGVYDLEMSARVNGVERSRGNWKDIHYSFGQLVSRASVDTYLFPGDVIGSGTVGTGCLLELTGGKGPWLQPGDKVDLIVDGIGVLSNQVGQAL